MSVCLFTFSKHFLSQRRNGAKEDAELQLVVPLRRRVRIIS
jgi:hypothetical protein